MSRRRQALTGLLALLTFVLMGAGVALRTHLTGLTLLGLAVPVAIAAWISLGAPVHRRDIRGATDA